VSGDIALDRKLALETTFYEKEVVLPDGNKIKLGKERFEASELLFNPSVGGLEYLGISDLCFEVIQKAPIDTRVKLYENIIVSGGTTMIPGFSTRFKNDIIKQYRERILKNSSRKMPFDIKVLVNIFIHCQGSTEKIL
jgi:actin-related protein 2